MFIEVILVILTENSSVETNDTKGHQKYSKQWKWP